MTVTRFLLIFLFSCLPTVAFAESGGVGLAFGLGIVALIAWSIAISLCKAGGGWILLGCVIGIFIAIPLTGYALLGAVVTAGAPSGPAVENATESVTAEAPSGPAVEDATEPAAEAPSTSYEEATRPASDVYDEPATSATQ